MSPAVYRRRRLMVLLIAIALIVAVVLVARSALGGDDTPAPKPTPTPGASSEPVATPTEDAPEGALQVVLTTSEEPCAAEDIRITPSVKAGQVTGGPVAIDLVVSTSGEKPCRLTAKEADLLVVISADTTPVYDSTVCRASLLKQPVDLTPGWSTVVTTEWSGRGSGSRCADDEGWASPGEYTIQLGTLGGEPGKATFTLARPKTEEKKDEDKKDDEDEKKSD